MTSRRVAKVSQAVREVVSTAILFELKDPRVRNVTVTSAEVSADLRSAKIYVSIMGDEKVQTLCMHGLDSARGFLQAKIAERLDTRYTPVLHFVLDQGVKRSIEAARLIREALADTRSPGPTETGPTETAAEDGDAGLEDAPGHLRSAPSAADDTG